ncbi:putative LRAT-like domain-containing protein [Helianthus annuus]|uniref:LRAT-like domain-containing protein n=2 Tax=Helianthus annuus TaxID=4232 RepID=A0A9K3J3J2_HELAN|nr:uncharacterized protein LOC110934274 [Helianthus annuus]KAF5807930.1 putative LRAT-like domain-containing protein [Helianthus annuus]
MDLFSQEIERSELKKGDHVYVWRMVLLYNHHGIYVGDGKIIHFVDPRMDGSFLSSSSSSSSLTRCRMSCCGSEKVAGSGVRMSCIDCFIENGSLCRYKYQAEKWFVVFKLRRGTCTTARSDRPEEVVHRATYLFENGYVEYDLEDNNCEDFALYCKTGLWSTNKSTQKRSSQVIFDLNKGIVKLRELGVRKDVVKVPVEELRLFVSRL